MELHALADEFRSGPRLRWRAAKPLDHYSDREIVRMALARCLSCNECDDDDATVDRLVAEAVSAEDLVRRADVYRSKRAIIKSHRCACTRR
jgi:hypothetical protein